jgi:hypothetical protein
MKKIKMNIISIKSLLLKKLMDLQGKTKRHIISLISIRMRNQSREVNGREAHLIKTQVMKFNW